MASSTSYPDVRSMAFSRFIVLSLPTIYEYYVFLYVFMLDLKLVLIVGD